MSEHHQPHGTVIIIIAICMYVQSVSRRVSQSVGGLVMCVPLLEHEELL